jgi:hypothetical protein
VTGDLIAIIARHLLRERTYEQTVAAAIADSHFESGTRTRLHCYVSIVRAFIGAVAIDLRDDLTLAFDRDARSSAWRSAAKVFGIVCVLNLLTESRLILDAVALGLDAVALIYMWRLPSLAVPALPLLMVPIAVVLTRRLGNAMRPVLVSAAIVSTVFLAASVANVPFARTADQYRYAAHWRARMDTADPPRSLEAIRQELTVPITRLDQRRARADNNRFIAHSILATCAGTFALALIGIGLARKRGWRAFVWYAAACAVYWLLIVMPVLIYQRLFFPVYPWTKTIALFIVGTLALLAARRDTWAA